MKKRFLQFGMTAKAVMIALLLGVAGKTYAYDFSAVCETGQTLYYNITDEENRYVELTYPGERQNPWPNSVVKPTGNIVLPTQVTYEGINYAITSIGQFAFYSCNGLTGSLNVPITVNSIGTGAFLACRGFTGNLIISNSVVEIGNSAFSNCSGFTGDLNIPNTVTKIGDNAFAYCSGFTGNLNISNSLTIIENYTFASCNGFTGDLIIPNSVTFIDYWAFAGCSGFSGSLTIPDSVTEIGEGAFSDCDGFSGCLTIGNQMRTIGQGAFSNCSGFSSLDLGDSVTTIGGGAFGGCCGISGILTIPNSVVSISYGAFYGCSGISSITIPASVSDLSNDAFNGTGWYNSQTNGILYLDNCCLGYKGEQPTGSLIIQEGTRLIANRAFSDCTQIVGTLTIPNSMVSIGESAFFFCIGFTGSLIIPNSVTTIKDNAFQACQGFDGTLVISNSVLEIGNYAFGGCNFTGILTIPNSVITIGEGAFSVCNGFDGLDLGTSVETIGYHSFAESIGFTGTLVIPNSVKTIEREAFYGCQGITSITLGNSITSITGNPFEGTGWYNNQSNGVLYLDGWCLGRKGMDPEGELKLCEGTKHICNEAFYGCSGINSVIIPNSMISIGWQAFIYCENLNSLTIGNSISSIGSGAFHSSNHNLACLTILAETPPFLDYLAFDNEIKAIPVCVPYGTSESYLATNGWSDFTNYQEIAYNSIPAHSQNGGWNFIASPLAEDTAPTEIYDMLPTTGTYDLYRFDQTENAEWRNYKANNFNLVNGQGYLYANAEDVNLIFKGTFNEDETKNVGLVYDANAYFAGWNLVGNPFPVNAYANKSYYTMNEDGSAIEPVAVSMETAIPACTGVMVKAENTGESVTFSKTAPETQGQNNGSLQIAVAQANTRGASTSSAAILDKAIVSFNEGDELGKFVFNKDNAKLYIPQGNEEYAIAYAAKLGEMPLNFEASENGEYTISIKAENAEFDYLHLIDNLTGTDIDLLPLCKGGKGDSQPATYTFTAKTTDYASRFRLVFSVSGDADSDDDTPFAFVNNGEIVITTGVSDATLQIVDVMGRFVYQGNVMNRVSTDEMTKGVYVIRLIKGDDVKTQKMVIE